jgi:hypothetical protein
MQVQVAHGAAGESAELEVHELLPVRYGNAFGTNGHQLPRLDDHARLDTTTRPRGIPIWNTVFITRYDVHDL